MINGPILGLPSIGTKLSPWLLLGSLSWYAFNQIRDSPFFSAVSEAQIIGKYLAHLIASGVLFPNQCIQLVGFSLGCQIIVSCLETLEKIENQQKSRLIEVILLGGAVRKSQLLKLSLNTVSGRIVNCYTHRDWTLQILYRASQLGNSPIGIAKVNHKSQKLINFDVSDIIGGHCDYRKYLDKVLQKISFNRDQMYQTKN